MGINWDIIKIKNTFEKLYYGDKDNIKKELIMSLNKYKNANIKNKESINRIKILTELIEEYS